MDYKELAKQLGARGGKKTLGRHGKDHFKRISQIGADARAKKRMIQFDTVEAKLPIASDSTA